jgi:hypothetical protein
MNPAVSSDKILTPLKLYCGSQLQPPSQQNQSLLDLDQL